MAARWGAGEETLTIGGMEFFTAGGPLQCHDLEEDETCDGLSDLTLSSLDAGGILGPFQGYVDSSIISIIDDSGAQIEHRDRFDDENELSLLTALTEILDNADDENMSPFDTIPDTELLVSPKDRDGSTKLLGLARTPTDHEMFSVDGQRRANSNKVDGRCPGPNWELFSDTISSTPKRPNRHKNVRGCLSRMSEAEETQQRSDGEDEEVPSLGDMPIKNSSLLAFDTNFSDAGADINDVDEEQILMQATPCIINTENVALNDLVKYMHPYCLPAITMCLESEEDENLLNNAVFLEIVSDQGECIKVPVVVEPPVDMLCSESSDGMEELDVKMDELPNHLSTSEQGIPESEMNNEIQIDCKSNKVLEPIENYNDVPKLPDLPHQPSVTEVVVDKPLDDNTCNSEEVLPGFKKTNEPDIPLSVTKEKVPLKGKRSSKNKQPSKSKLKSKMKTVARDKSPEPVTVQSIAPPPPARPNNPSMQESDFLIKTLDQVKKESQMELRSSKIGRTKTRTRMSFDSSNPEKKMSDWRAKPVSKESEQAKNSVTVHVDKELEKKAKPESSKAEETQDSAVDVEGLQSNKENVLIASQIGGEESSINEESGALKAEDVQEDDSSQSTKETKPKSLSLSEYRKRLQHRKPNPNRDNENLSCSKWPTVPEPPKELAELPCLILPAQSNKPSIGEKACHGNKLGNVPAADTSTPTTGVQTPVSSHSIQHLNEKPCPAVQEVAPHPVIPPQPILPPPFYPPAWPTVPPHPFYPGMPPLAAIPHYPNSMPTVLPVQPPPVMNWPPFPPPPLAVPPVHPTGWVSGPPTPFWPNAQISQGVTESHSLHNSGKSVPYSASNFLAPSDQKIQPEPLVPPVEYRLQSAVLPVVQTNRAPVLKPENSVGLKEAKTAAKPESIKCNKPSAPEGPQVRPVLNSDAALLAMKATKKSENATIIDSKKTNLPLSDLKSANQVVFKIMEILKKAQKLGFQIKPSSDTTANTQLGTPVAPSVSTLKSAQPMLADDKAQVASPVIVVKSSTQGSPEEPVAGSSKVDKSEVEKIPATGSATGPESAEEKLASPCKVSTKEEKEPVLPCAETLCASEGSFQTITESNLKEPEKSFTCESGIEASDLTSLLEQFEKSEAKVEEQLPQSPDKLAVGNSGTGKPVEKKILDKPLAPELVNTAGLTPPATPPHQLWKSGPLTGKCKPLSGQEKTCSPLKTAKLIEPKPLPQNRLKNRNFGSSSVALPPIHVASGDHDYCILTNQRTENKATAAAPPVPPSQCEEGSRWNVKHHQNITIKPIVQFNKRQQNKACPKQLAPSAPSVVPNQSTTCGPINPAAPSDSIPKASCDPLDHRTNITTQSSVVSPPGSVLMSPDSSPCRSENRESGTDLKKSTSVSRRSLRCYRKYKGSPSPQRSSWRGKSSGSRSDSRSSSSSSRSRSGSPASKRRRISRYRSRSRHRSRSSSRSSYGTSSSSRSSSCSSRSCSPSSRSRSRSRSPYRRRYRSRSRRCESRESYNRRKMFHKERAIEERRVVYVGKINSQMTRSELRRRFSVFGEIEECTIHFRDEGDNYGFVTYRCTREAFAAIENGHKLRLPDELPFDLCFGGRRQFCKSNYADLDSNRDDFDPAPVRSKFETLDFDTLLKQAQKTLRR